MRELIKCPHCGKSHYREDYHTSTAMGWSPVVKDGVRYDEDPNIHTTHCTCLECGGEFSFDNRGGISKGRTGEEIQSLRVSSDISLNDDSSKPFDLNRTLLDKRQYLNISTAQFKPNIVIQCEEIHLTKDAIDITINDDMMKYYESITINGRTYKFEN